MYNTHVTKEMYLSSLKRVLKSYDTYLVMVDVKGDGYIGALSYQYGDIVEILCEDAPSIYFDIERITSIEIEYDHVTINVPHVRDDY